MMVQITYGGDDDYDATVEGHAVAGCGTCKRDVSYSLKYNYGHAWEVKYDTVIIGINVILGKHTFTEKLKYVATSSVTMGQYEYTSIFWDSSHACETNAFSLLLCNAGSLAKPPSAR